MSANNNVTSFNKQTNGLNSRMHIPRKRKVVDENMKKYNEDDISYSIMCKLRQYLVKLEIM